MSLNIIKLNRALVTYSRSLVRMTIRRIIDCLGCFFVGGMALFSGEILALEWDLGYSDVSYGFSDCVYTEASDEFVRIEVFVSFNSANGRLNGATRFRSRGVTFYLYDEKGVLRPPSSRVEIGGISLNGTSNEGGINIDGYVIWEGRAGSWLQESQFSGRISFLVPRSIVAAWPSVGVRVSNITAVPYLGVVIDSAGVVFVTLGSNGRCGVSLNPENPPPAFNSTVTMIAPDWGLGELPRGKETVLELPNQLCFIYEGSTAITSQKYLINATNANGLSSDGRYLLRNLEDSSQTAPYALTLRNGDDLVSLPNTLNRVFSLLPGARTCLAPTFRVEPDKAVKGGAYSDILTFTVVAKP